MDWILKNYGFGATLPRALEKIVRTRYFDCSNIQTELLNILEKYNKPLLKDGKEYKLDYYSRLTYHRNQQDNIRDWIWEQEKEIIKKRYVKKIYLFIYLLLLYYLYEFLI